MPSAPSVYGNAESCPALWIRGLVPGQFLHYFPAPEETPLFGCKEAATSDLITPRQGEHMLVGFGDASGGRYATDTRYRRVGTAAIIMDFPRHRLDRHRESSRPAAPQHDSAHATLHRGGPDCRCGCMRLSLCAQAGCRCCLGRRNRLREASSGLSSSHSPTHAAPSCILPTTWGWSQAFGEKRHFFPSGPLEKLWDRIGQLVTERGSSVEVRHCGQATPRPTTWLKDARSFHRCWATTWPTRWHACRRILWNATRSRYSLTHIWSS